MTSPFKGLTHCLSMEMRITDFEFQTVTARSPSSEGVESSYLDTNSVSIDILKIWCGFLKILRGFSYFGLVSVHSVSFLTKTFKIQWIRSFSQCKIQQKHVVKCILRCTIISFTLLVVFMEPWTVFVNWKVNPNRWFMNSAQTMVNELSSPFKWENRMLSGGTT